MLEIAALSELTQQARNARVRGLRHKFDKIVHVGHSFGSIMTYGLSSMYPNATDAIVLTGFSQVPSFMPYFALGADFAPVRENAALAHKYADGYVAPKDSIGTHITFFAPNHFDPKILKFATKSGQPAALGELLTIGDVPETNSFPGPVLIITGGKYAELH